MIVKADEGYFFGIGAFETVAVEEGWPVLLKEHYERLQRAMEFLEISLDGEELKEKVQECLSVPGMQKGRKVMKITASPENLLVTSRGNTYGEMDYQRGFAARFSQVRRNETSPLTYHKTLNYGDCLLEKHKAKAAGMDEPIFLNTRGEIAEGATTNVFFVKNGEIFTPPVSCGMLPGILREYICRKYPVQEKVIYPEELAEYEEMFLTNSLLGVMPVASLENKKFMSFEKGRKLLEDYRRFCSSRASILAFSGK